LLPLQGALDRHFQLIGMQGLQNIVSGAELHCLHSVIYRAKCSHQNDRCIRIVRLDAAEQIQSAQARHADVRDHERGIMLLKQSQAVDAVARGLG